MTQSKGMWNQASGIVVELDSGQLSERYSVPHADASNTIPFGYHALSHKKRADVFPYIGAQCKGVVKLACG
jgi:hypothetical protein